jgi:hypothetical protein
VNRQQPQPTAKSTRAISPYLSHSSIYTAITIITTITTTITITTISPLNLVS